MLTFYVRLKGLASLLNIDDLSRQIQWIPFALWPIPLLMAVLDTGGFAIGIAPDIFPVLNISMLLPPSLDLKLSPKVFF